MWVHFGDGEFELTDPVDSSTVTGVVVKRVHDGGCGLMQYEQLKSESSCAMLKKIWKEIAKQLPAGAAHARRRAEPQSYA